MKSIYCSLVLLFASVLSLKAQVPVLSPISGPGAVCSAPSASLNTYSVSATNSPNTYNWSVVPAAGVNMVGNGALRNIVFPNTNLTYTIFCTAGNSSGASNTTFFVVTVFETPTITFTGSNFFCQGSATNLSASSTILYSASSSLSYSWSPATGLNTTTGPNVIATPPTTTTYTVQMTLGSCVNTYQTTLFANAMPTVSVVANPLTICDGESATISITGNANLYYFNFVQTTNNSVVVSPGVTTTYTVSGRTSICTTYTTITQYVDPCVGIKTNSSSQDAFLNVYPNPSNGSFIIKSPRNEKIIISNELGQVMRQVELISNEETEIRELPPGIYFISSGFVKSKIVVTR